MFKLYISHRHGSSSCLHFPKSNTLLIILEYNNRHFSFCDTEDTLLGAIDITDEEETITLTSRNTKFIDRKIFIILKRIAIVQGLPLFFLCLEI